MMAGARLIVIRHGRSAHPRSGGFIDAEGMNRWRDDEDAAGITQTSAPPPELAERVARAGVVMASDLRRAVESAERLAPARPIQISPLFRECKSITPAWLPFRWPLNVWLVGTGVEWMVRILRGTEASPSERQRALQASRWLTELASEHELIAVVGHGMFRRLLAKQLLRDGWSDVPGPHSYRHWSAWEFTAP